MRTQKHALILAGGIGARLWPMSRLQRPKQFLQVESGPTLLGKTMERARLLFDRDSIWVVCKPYQVDEVNRQLPDLDSSKIIVEPVPKGTAGAVILGVMTICKRCPEAVVSVFPSDHSIKPTDRFANIIEAGMEWASANFSIVTYGIRPDSPETSYGYIEAGGTVGQCSNWNCMEVTSFHEKPDPKTANAYFRSNRFLWNSGMLSFSVKVLDMLLKDDAFSVWEPLYRICASRDEISLDEVRQIYDCLPEDSFDTAILEKLARCRGIGASGLDINLVVFPCDFEWYDLGVWESFYRMLSKDESGNALSGKVATVDCRGSLVFSKGDVLVGAIGLQDMVVVCVDDAVLVCPRRELDRVRELVEVLAKGDYKDYV